MNRVGRLQPCLVVRLPTFRRELLGLSPVKLRELPSDDISILEVCGIDQRVEETPADDLEAFLRGCGTPSRLDAPDDVAEALESFPAALTAHLGVVRLCVRRAGRVRR